MCASPRETKGESNIHSHRKKEDMFYCQVHMCASTDMRERGKERKVGEMERQMDIA